jgi:CxxC motif-containing protein (DUF1111 family)
MIMKGWLTCIMLVLAAPALAQTDPGVRGGAAGAGGPLPGISPAAAAFFNAASALFQEVDDVPGGLGPRFNLNQCSGCHAQPAVGGSSPPTNPQVAVATLNGARNVLPSFISESGPVREARFIKNPDGTPDGGVHALFVITGRTDAPAGCNIAQPDFATELRHNNVIFRIPTPLFGLGLVEATPDQTLVDSFNQSARRRHSLGIAGRFNHSGNDGTITRFGWKAQNKSLLIFAAEAYNVEQGVTNEGFPSEREPGCNSNGTPEDPTKLTGTTPPKGSLASDYSADIVNFAGFIRLLAPPQPASAMGREIFSKIGCDACHTMSLTTGQSSLQGLSNVTYAPFSDFALHHMGVGLADHIVQGRATGAEFRTAPLWGLGQRLFFLHDGRANNLIEAIEHHASEGSEANAVIGRYHQLSASDKQTLLNYLRSF